MSHDFSSQVAIVSGGASGIGEATCRKLAECGARVVVADLNIEGAERVAANIGADAEALRLDVTSEEQWQGLIDDVLAKLGAVDLLVNAAGIGFAGDFESFPLEQWNAVLTVNLTGVFLGCKHGIRGMRKSGKRGAIVNMSSVGGLIGTADLAAYNASKAGVTSLTKSLALHCTAAGLDIRCNAVHPTVVDSPMLDPLAAAFPSREAMLEVMAAAIPAGRVVRTDEIADAILFLLSDLAGMINGSGLLIDGAQLAGMSAGHTPAEE